MIVTAPAPSTPEFAIPPAEVAIDARLVRRLLAGQHPDLASLALDEAESGFDNVIFRLGERLAVRLARRKVADPLLVLEQRWLPGLAARLPLPIPAPVRIGLPNAEYPFAWSVVPWLEGEAADLQPPAAEEAAMLARFLECLHVAAPPDAPRNRFRGVPLRSRAEAVEERLRRLDSREALQPGIWRAWEEALEAEPATEETWVHGDLHSRNVLVRAGRITGVIDWGDLCVGDKATDLAAIWMLLPDVVARREAMRAYPDRSPALWARARGWAIVFGAILLDTGLNGHERHARMGERALASVAEDARGGHVDA